MLELLRKELMSIEEGLYYMEQNDSAWTMKGYNFLCRKRRIIVRTIKKLERLERRYR